MKTISTLILALSLSITALAAPQKDFTHETPGQRAKRMAWFNEARFGLFIHWGVYSVPAGEWQGKTNYGEWFLEETKMPVSQYEKFAQQFNPVKFDAHEWVRVAKDAGMKYIVITSKHHDGFAMFRSDMSDWGIKSTPFQRDPLKELATECRKAGIKMCFYHSIMDWHHPDWGTRRAWNDKATGEPDMDRYVDYMKGQLHELLTRYGPIGILWFDGEWEKPWTHERGVDLYNYVRGLQPRIIVNNRVGKARSGMQGMDKEQGVGDYGTPEQEIPPTGFGSGVSWESCMTMNNHWGYNKNDQHWKSTQTLARNLIDCASKGGNYLLNVGPTSEGLIPEDSVERLAALGQWMKVNHEAIYGTQASPFKRLSWGRCTQMAGSSADLISSPKFLEMFGGGGRSTTTLYLHVFNWPENGRLLVPGLKNHVKKAYLLADSRQKPLPVEARPDGVAISVPSREPDPISSTVVLKLKGPLEIEDKGLVQNADGSLTFVAADAKLHGNEIKYESGEHRDNLGFWTNPDDWAEWDFTVTRTGRFEVTCDVASLGDTSFEVRVGQSRLRGQAQSTGDYGNFKPVKLGSVEFTTAGKLALGVHAVKDGWQPINLRSVKLKPAL